MIANPDVLLDGMDSVLLTLQDALDAEVFDISLPLSGRALAPAGQFIESFRQDLLAPLSDLLRQGGGGLNPVDGIQQVLFDIFASESQGAQKLCGGLFGALGLLQFTIVIGMRHGNLTKRRALLGPFFWPITVAWIATQWVRDV